MTTKKTDAEPDYVLKPATLPKRGDGGKYKNIVKEFMEGEDDTVLIDGPLVQRLKPATLVTSLQIARKGLPVSVRTERDGDGNIARIYLQKKPLK